MSSEIILTTGDLKQDYEVLGPVYFQLSNRGGGLFKASVFSTLKTKYSAQIQALKNAGGINTKPEVTRAARFLGGIVGEFAQEPTDFEISFYIATQEIKKRAAFMGAHGIVCIRQDIDLDSTGFQYFYLQMYGTAVRFK